MPGRRFARFNRRVTNHVIGVWAPYVPPWAVVVHRGRRSGTTYRTPIAAFIAGSTAAVALPYGADTDWVKNLLADDGGQLTRRGRTVAFTHPRVVARSEIGQLPPRLRRVGRAAPHTLLVDLEAS